MLRHPLYWLSAIATLALAAPAHVARQADTYPCTDGVFILGARGADSSMISPIGVSPNYQDLEGLEVIANALIQHVGKGSYLRALPYAAAIEPGVDLLNIGGGVDKAQSIIKDYVGRCTNPRIVLLGFSTGAQVMTSTLIGGQLRGNLDAYKQYITAGALFGDPSFTANVEPLDAGNSTTSGASARSASDAAYYNQNYGSKLRNYCQAGDAACANGGLGDAAVAIHLAAIQTYQQDAINFLTSIVS
ncbi:carbohydrate esterase family 5 protein [Zasmidium cellare ATCC 36951]|uniref:Carbohydrate esterase family 5 protein n=1 Tax=Zasmidium cellare ATCC 36951 TaxID=1080233 RepID=A0A6A6CXY6_ZASCE|nr:carbohydrate esterase family 5 protein [Zasmidium cellare ATCC 36951]KAF2171040.1 carbohydrate esterase family 5 protein [Zasmidium cellare ATCC 36951]